MQLAIDAEQLQVECALVLRDAPQGPTVAQTDCHRPIGWNCSAATASASARRSRGRTSRIAQRLFDLLWPAIAA
jgi:hypothetical protein